MTENSQQTIERLIDEGKLTTVAQEIGDSVERVAFEIPRMEGYTPQPFPSGIYFGLPDHIYHSVPALSCSGIRMLASSPMYYWARTAWLNPEIEPEEDADWKAVGRAYHARILEGEEAFNERFAIALDPADYPDALIHTEQIKAAIARHSEKAPVKPCSTRKDDLVAQLEALEGKPLDPAGLKVEDLKDRIRQHTCDQPVVPVRTVADTLPDSDEVYQRPATKADWVRQLLALDPKAVVWDELCRKHVEANAGKAMLPFEVVKKIEIAARMIERHEELSRVLRGGYPEVSLFWTCPKTGVPMKARADYIKVKGIVDLKSYENKLNLSPFEAIRKAIANNRYNLQPSVYFEGAAEVRKLVRQHGAKAVYMCDGDEITGAEGDELAWALKWANNQAPDEWLWIFQQKGIAPITRGVAYPRGGSVRMISDEIVSRMKRRFRQFAETFGAEAWLDVEPIYDLADEDIPPWATEI